MKVSRNKLSVTELHALAPDKAYWRRRTVGERMRAVQLNRQVAYGRASVAQRLQRVLEVVERG